MWLLIIIQIYVIAGLAFGIAFFLKGYVAIAPEAEGASIATRLLWTPAAIALWPLLLSKWLAARKAMI